MRALFFILLFAAFTSEVVAIDFAPTIVAAREAEHLEDHAKPRPMVVMFSSETCTWCRKMEVDTFASEPIAKIADQFVWAKVDVEEHEDLGAEFNVRGLPTLVVLNGENRVIASEPGYQPPERFVAFLTKALENPAPLDDVLPNLLDQLQAAKEAKERNATIRAIVERIASADRQGRMAAVEELAKAGSVTWPRLAELLADERLAVRAAAANVLAKSTGADLSFDAFAAMEERTKQIESWRNWIDEHVAKAEIEDSPEI